MKYLKIGTFLLMGIANSAAANCFDDGYTNVGISGDISGKRILATAPDGEDWKEDHCTSGLYKVGDGTAVDPYAFRGTWLISGNTVEYSYTGISSPYIWLLYNDGSGGLCWQNAGGAIIATGSASGSAGPCSTTP